MLPSAIVTKSLALSSPFVWDPNRTEDERGRGAAADPVSGRERGGSGFSF